MKNYSFLEYNFMFDSSDAFTNLYEFESALVDFFSTRNMEAEIVKTVEGQFGKRILLIKRKEHDDVIVMDKSPQSSGVKPDKFRK